MISRACPLFVALGMAVSVAAQPVPAAAPGPRPKAYVIAELIPTDADAYRRDYAAHVEPVVRAHGGRYLARGGHVEALEGPVPMARQVIIEFPDVAAAKAFWASDAYQPLAAIRRKLASGRIFLVEGVPAPQLSQMP